MKIVTKTYLLISVLVAVAAFNLFLLYQEGSGVQNESNSIIRVADIKVKAESISGFAELIANGNMENMEGLEEEIDNVEQILESVRNGGSIEGTEIAKAPTSEIFTQLNQVLTEWEEYRFKVENVKDTPVFDEEATNAANYVLEKNQDLVLLTDQLVRDLNELDRDYNRHKQIAEELAECARGISQQTLLISIGEEGSSQESLKEKRVGFEIGLRKLLGISTQELDVQSVGAEHEDLDPIPRANSDTLRQLEPLWESIQIRIQVLEERALLSPEFNVAKNEMMEQKEVLFEKVNSVINAWNAKLASEKSSNEVVVEILLAANILIFIAVVLIIKQSLSPLNSITRAISKVKEGVYGEKIEYSGSDEVGELVSNFNIMSDTIKAKDEEAKQTDIAKDEFLAMITHELKTPLVPIQGYSDILLSEHLGKLTDKQKERIKIIKDSSATLLAIISDLLDAQKLELGQLRMKKENRNINETICSAVNALLPEAQRNNIELTLNTRDLEINHDPERIKQVITNLVKNSLTAVKPDTGKIHVSMEESPTEIKVLVKDNGIGIPIDKQADLFKKFYQVDATLTREMGGSGLGLAICKGIIDNHEGQITVQSSPNQGAVFSFTLPKGEKSKSSRNPIGTA
ncbi:integral membrane sensor signal transduction histidine kinase [Candidatus Nitrosopumilus koreensis AR1]|uniref:histidine kinase n=1 Tax=Candidatus Nitrosopumilus koreensis AR1 TaxID=1229908 RepID=K0B9K9_9ARCH|nr:MULTISPECIES: HAMP domain-containing sensor histidine kinase [Nitrosopumilus]AFS81151.1 integral membrane sensor signal transduction histidine kinase [Candidatus Nitrosopumilus koreensis AR1]